MVLADPVRSPGVSCSSATGSLTGTGENRRLPQGRHWDDAFVDALHLVKRSGAGMLRQAVGATVARWLHMSRALLSRSDILGSGSGRRALVLVKARTMTAFELVVRSPGLVVQDCPAGARFDTDLRIWERS